MFVYDIIIRELSNLFNREIEKKEKKSVMIIIPNSLSYDKKVRTGSVSVRSVNYTSVQSNWIHKERFLYAREFLFVMEGTVHIKVDDRIYHLSKNDFVVLSPFSIISSEKMSDTACAFYSITYEGDIDILNMWGKEKQSLTGNVVFVYEVMKKMRTCYRPEQRENPALDILFLTLAYELQSQGIGMVETGLPMQKMLDYIHDHVNSPIDVSDLCKEFNYSCDYISKLFRQCYGITVKRYINQVKMAAAKQLLTTSHLTIEQVGNSVGFDNVLLFYKYFRYHEKMTPSEYRKLHR